MSSENTSKTRQALNQATRAIWNQNAEFWDQKLGEGNFFCIFVL